MGVEPVDSMPDALRSFRHQDIEFHVYETPGAMGKASAIALADSQIDLAGRQDAVSFLIMAAPSAFPFYDAYVALVQSSTALQQALLKTHFFQFDDYPLPGDHPASFRYLLREHLFSRLEEWTSPARLHLLNVDDADPEPVCKEYTRTLLSMGPDIQLKGVGENGHWGFHEPGISLDGEPAYIRVTLSEENAAQQLRDHPELFRGPGDVPREAYTANVPLFLRTRHAIEDNVPQASKAFALLAAYATDVVHSLVPSSALKRHPHAVVRTTSAASWALEEYLERGSIAQASVDALARSLGGDSNSNTAESLNYIEGVLNTLRVAVRA